jgi:4-amino-4-deoxy-L-arabinose transferase-like glycosyltransferase
LTIHQSRTSGRVFRIGLGLLLMVGFVLRLPLMSYAAGSYRLTEAFNIEEVESVRLSTGMLHKHTLNPHAFEYPSLFYELSLMVEAPLRATGHGTWHAYLIGVRALSLLFGLGAIALVALLARRLGGDGAGLLAATLVTFDRTMIDISTLAKPNAAQLFFLLAGFLALAALAARPRTSVAIAAAACFALATASKWLGALGLAGLMLAPLLSAPSSRPPGLPRLFDSIRAGASSRIAAWQLALPVLVFAALFVACVPYAILSPREFGFGLAQTFTAQSVHQRAGSIGVPVLFLIRSLGPVGALLAAAGLVWGIAVLLRWEGSPEDRGLVLVLGWALAYGALVVFVFVKLPSYIDLWVPFLAVIAGCAWCGARGLLRSRTLRFGALAIALIAEAVSNGLYPVARAAAQERADSRLAAGRWIEAHAAPGDSLLADLSIYVPDRYEHVSWNWWGSPPRTVYDENRTWGWDPIWPGWYGGHRRLTFENGKWRDALVLLADRPRWVITSDEWAAIRANPTGAGEVAAPDYDRSLADGRAGYVLRARFDPRPRPASDWAVLRTARSAGTDSLLMGPRIKIYERVR